MSTSSLKNAEFEGIGSQVDVLFEDVSVSENIYGRIGYPPVRYDHVHWDGELQSILDNDSLVDAEFARRLEALGISSHVRVILDGVLDQIRGVVRAASFLSQAESLVKLASVLVRRRIDMPKSPDEIYYVSEEVSRLLSRNPFSGENLFLHDFVLGRTRAVVGLLIDQLLRNGYLAKDDGKIYLSHLVDDPSQLIKMIELEIYMDGEYVHAQGVPRW